MERHDILGKLADPDLPLLTKIRLATCLEIDLWVDRQKPNLGENEIKKLLKHIPQDVQVAWEDRISRSGKHGATGEDQVFVSKFSTRFFGAETFYYVKGYFFDKGNCKGVCFQSFRATSKKSLNKIRLVRVT